MVIGNGMIAKAFESYRDEEGFIIFASGVSDSVNVNTEAFEREIKLIKNTIETHKDKLLVYFSTCSIYDESMQDSAYVQHKIKVEKIIMDHYAPFIIFRLTNPIGKTRNTRTLVNFFIKNIIEKSEFTVWKNASRNIIDIDHLYLICNEILQQKQFLNTIINIANPENYPVGFIINAIEDHFNIKGKYIMEDKGGSPVIDITAIKPLFTKFNINFDEHYLPGLLQKYFPNK
ncbi:MAG: NAD-dependent epimerase/dehydratase family protein [Chitinophagaceae bacterium]|nr:NAD-dependent epimerase/dehydratase family protein [Chitinophagaceae bacterium]